jgi:RimJ/RimL family protein N-acetyltransferase
VERGLTGGAGGPRRVPFDETYLDRSYDWLTDPELARLTMSGAVTREGQRRWYDGLSGRDDYAVWGVEYDGVPVGVMGLKHLGEDDGGEYFFYVGDRSYWGRGIAAWAFREICAVARERGLAYLWGMVGKHNERSLGVHTREGFVVVGETETEYRLEYRL